MTESSPPQRPARRRNPRRDGKSVEEFFEEATERRRRIMALIAQGLKQREVAERENVTLAYVSSLVCKARREGLDAVIAQGLPGPKEKIPINREEFEETVRIIQSPPAQAGFDATAWTVPLIQRWFQQRFKRRPSVYQIRSLLMEAGIKLTVKKNDESAFEGLLPNSTKTAGRPPKRRPQTRLARARRGPRAAAAMEYPVEVFATPPIRRSQRKIGRNDPCPFDPSKKFKRCCGAEGLDYCRREEEAGQKPKV